MNKDFDQLKGKKANAFGDIPEGYFDALHKNVLDGIDQQNTIGGKREFLPRAIAAIFLLFLVSATVLLFTIHPNTDSEKVLTNHNTSAENLMEAETLVAINSDILNITEQANSALTEIEQTEESLVADIPLDDIIDYLIEKEELEF